MWLRATYAPLFFFGFLALGVWIAQTPVWPLWTLMAPLVCAVAVSFVVERTIPYQPDWNGWQRDTPRDLAHAGVNESLNLAGVALWST
ncbi:MAG: sterol desaturase family protein, partial [Lysobacteraceae bacterium]